MMVLKKHIFSKKSVGVLMAGILPMVSVENEISSGESVLLTEER